MGANGHSDGTHHRRLDSPTAVDPCRAATRNAFVDKTMSPTQQAGLARACRSRWPRASRNVHRRAHDIYKRHRAADAQHQHYGMARCPRAAARPSGALSGGNDYCFRQADTPAPESRPLKWIN